MSLRKLDVINQVCPFPLIEAKEEMETLSVGDELLIEFDCTQATESLPRWAAESGYNVTDFQQLGDALWSIAIQKTC